jgi:hypothetical protein
VLTGLIRAVKLLFTPEADYSHVANPLSTPKADFSLSNKSSFDPRSRLFMSG